MLAFTFAINALEAVGFINGLSQKEISDMYVALITPSPSTFSIWGVIFSLLIIPVIVMIIKKGDPYDKGAVKQLSTLFVLSCIVNIAWIVAFPYVQLELSMLFIFGLVITVSFIWRKLLKI